MGKSNIAPVSVIIPCYCSSQYLKRAVESVLNQTVLPAEIILIDDASPDQGNTKLCIASIVNSYAKYMGINFTALFLEENLGPGGARNAGWDIAKEKYIAFLDADDSWTADKLAIQYKWMLEHAEYVLSCHDSSFIGDKFNAINNESHGYTEIQKIPLIIKNSIPTRTVMLLKKIEYRFPYAMRHSEDYWLWLNMCMRGERMAKINKTLAYSYKKEYGEGGLSANLGAMHAGVLTCYVYLWRQRLIGVSTFVLASLWEYIKYFKRVMFVLAKK